jgi:hypothetical protein
MTEPTPVTEDGEVIGLPPNPPAEDDVVLIEEPPPSNLLRLRPWGWWWKETYSPTLPARTVQKRARDPRG